MDAAEVARITAALVAAIADTSARAKEIGIDSEFREIVRHSREMHVLLVEAMVDNEPLHTEYRRVGCYRRRRQCDSGPAVLPNGFRYRPHLL